jgi:hypothetical protein
LLLTRQTPLDSRAAFFGSSERVGVMTGETKRIAVGVEKLTFHPTRRALLHFTICS